MAKIYRITADPSCWGILPSRSAFSDRLDLFKVQPMGGKCDVGERFYVRDPLRTSSGDFFGFTNGALVFTDQVLDGPLGEIIQLSGEILQAVLEGALSRRISFFNCTACYNCLDIAKTSARWTPQMKAAVDIKRYGFHKDRIGDQNLFKVPETHIVELYALSGRDDPEDEFYHQYHALGYTGLVFREVWSDEG